MRSIVNIIPCFGQPDVRGTETRGKKKELKTKERKEERGGKEKSRGRRRKRLALSGAGAPPEAKLMRRRRSNWSLSARFEEDTLVCNVDFVNES